MKLRTWFALSIFLDQPRHSNLRSKIIKESVNESVIHEPAILLKALTIEDTLRALIRYFYLCIAYLTGGLECLSNMNNRVCKEEVENP